jgi:PKD repeat protein
MKKSLIALFFLCLWITGTSSGWIPITSPEPIPAKINLMSSDIERSIVHFTIGGFNLLEVQTPQGPAFIVNIGEATPILEAGAPDLPKLTTSLIIPDLAGMNVRILSASFQDFPDRFIAPSKGNISRQVDPATVPYQFGQTYQTDRFYPGLQADLRDPFIIRELRGQTLIVYPVQYNPVSRVLRVYYDITAEVYKANEAGINPLNRQGNEIKLHPDFLQVYSRHFLNFNQLDYTPLGEYGNLLVICYGAFMNDMLPYVNWKNASGYPTEMVNVATIGNTATQIKNYIVNYYNTYGLTAVLLVGDAPQIPTNTGGGLGGPSDNAYGYIVGNDHYSDVYIGRFSAENTSQVQTQVQRTLNYEINPQLLTDDWYTTVFGIASDQGPGDDNEYDFEHVRNMQTDCLAFTYTWNPEQFDGSQGGNDPPGNPTPQQIATEVNGGTGLILYCGHGSATSWGTSGFNNNNVNQLVNMDKLPFIWSVACQNGAFMSTTCFAEAWLRASQGGQPTGAIAFLGSTINQSWNSPMEGQDEMVDILTEQYPNNIKRTYAGLSINGCMKMIDTYGVDGQNMADTWTLFGDPMIIVRTDNPETMTVTHLPTVFVGTTSLVVNCNVEGARATLSVADTILATGLISSGSVTLTFPALTTSGDSLHLVVTAFNYIPYQADLPIITPNGPYILYQSNVVNDYTGNNDHQVDYGEEIDLTITLKNIGVDSTTNLMVKVISSDPYIDITDTLEGYGVIAPNQIKSVADGFFFNTNSQIPDGHDILFTVISTDVAGSWTDNFTLTAHAPILNMNTITINDSTGNDNGQLDPGETAYLTIPVSNLGSSAAYTVNGDLIAISPWVNVTQSTQLYGDMNPGQTVANVFEVVVDTAAPEGQYAPFMFGITAQRNIVVNNIFYLIVGNVPALVVNLDGNSNSAPAMKTAIESLGLPVDYAQNIPDDVSQYTAIFVALGIYPDKHILTGIEGQKLAGYLNEGGRLYMEGGDTWVSDPQTAVHPKFQIMGYNNGQGDLTNILGQNGTFTSGMTFMYNGDNASIDRITYNTFAFNIFKNQTPSYFNATAFDGGTYRTIGSSFEFGGLIDGIHPSTKQHLMEEYLNFFGIQPPPLAANFAGYPTEIETGQSVNFYDFSTGAISSWLWSFPGGTPSTSTERNPVITYNNIGVYDVQLIVSDGTLSDTLLRSAYITVDAPTTIREHELSCTIAPNPNNGQFSLYLNSPVGGLYDLTIYHMAGVPVYHLNGISVQGIHSVPLNLTNIPKGLYFLNLKGNQGFLTKKILIQ